MWWLKTVGATAVSHSITPQSSGILFNSLSKVEKEKIERQNNFYQTFTGTRRAENPPEILVHPEGILESRPGEPVTMVCQAQGYPEPRIDFFKDGRKIRTNENHVIGEGRFFTYNYS